jgi:gas vesicle protein
MTQNPRNERESNGSAIWGFVLGLLIGGFAALLGAPQSNKTMGQRVKRLSQTGHEKLENVTPADPLADSIAMGKAAARRRLEELGLDK